RPLFCRAVFCLIHASGVLISIHTCFSPRTFPGRRWLGSMGREDWVPSRFSVLCIHHFEEQHIDRTGKCITLREEAVPTIFSPTTEVRGGQEQRQGQRREEEQRFENKVPALTFIPLNLLCDVSGDGSMAVVVSGHSWSSSSLLLGSSFPPQPVRLFFKVAGGVAVRLPAPRTCHAPPVGRHQALRVPCEDSVTAAEGHGRPGQRNMSVKSDLERENRTFQIF
uniref:THAP-type domain-containing protein n=1 Tax=Periophthalmus magnuspinnatus TaxID=409849 RepID=A0A3B3ZTZ5_9GOBI